MVDQVIDNSENQVVDNEENIVVIQGEELPLPKLGFKKIHCKE